MAKNAYEYPVKVYDGDSVSTVTESSWTKARRRIVRTCAVGGADGATLSHREPAKSISCKKDSKGIYRAYIGESKKIEAKLRVDGKIKFKGSRSLVLSAHNMLDYRLNELQGKNVKLEIIED